MHRQGNANAPQETTRAALAALLLPVEFLLYNLI